MYYQLIGIKCKCTVNKQSGALISIIFGLLGLELQITEKQQTKKKKNNNKGLLTQTCSRLVTLSTVKSNAKLDLNLSGENSEGSIG